MQSVTSFNSMKPALKLSFKNEIELDARSYNPEPEPSSSYY